MTNHEPLHIKGHEAPLVGVILWTINSSLAYVLEIHVASGTLMPSKVRTGVSAFASPSGNNLFRSLMIFPT